MNNQQPYHCPPQTIDSTVYIDGIGAHEGKRAKDLVVDDVIVLDCETKARLLGKRETTGDRMLLLTLSVNGRREIHATRQTTVLAVEGMRVWPEITEDSYLFLRWSERLMYTITDKKEKLYATNDETLTSSDLRDAVRFETEKMAEIYLNRYVSPALKNSMKVMKIDKFDPSRF